MERNDISRLISLFDRLYKLGVEDGCRFGGDEGLCRSHIEATREPGSFGLVRDGYFSDALDWQLTLLRQAKAAKIYASVHRLLVRMGAWGAVNYLSCILPLAQDFYNLGLSDYLDNPGADSPVTFMGQRRRWWGGRRVDNYGYVETIQTFCGRRMRSEAEALANLVETRCSRYQRIGEHDLRKRVLREKWWIRFRTAVALVCARD